MPSQSEYSPPAEYEERGAASGVGLFGIMASEYSLVEKVNVLRGLFDVFEVMYPQLQDIDFREDATKLDVPVYLLDGDHELSARRDLAVEWYDRLEAPKKQIFPLENAGHARLRGIPGIHPHHERGRPSGDVSGALMARGSEGWP